MSQDSKYVFFILHAHAAIYKGYQKGFLTAAETPVKHHQDIPRLLDAVLLFTQVAVINFLGSREEMTQ